MFEGFSDEEEGSDDEMDEDSESDGEEQVCPSPPWWRGA